MIHAKFQNSMCTPPSPFPRNGQNMALSWPKDGPHMVLKISSSWIIINVPREAPCDNSQIRVYPIVPASKKWPKYGPYMAKTWSRIVLQINLIDVPMDAPCQISQFRVYPKVPFSKKWPKYGHYMAKTWSRIVLKIGFSWIIINVLMDAPCQISQFWVYPIVPFY